MPSLLVDRYALFFRVTPGKRVREVVGRYPSLLVAVEQCVGIYQTTGHYDYAIEDQRRQREFLVDRDLLLRLAYLKRHDEPRYFEVLNRLDREGSQEDLVRFLGKHASI